MDRRRRERQSGQAIVIVGAMIIALTILGTMVFDVGLAMSDRRNLQAYADAAALAGSRSFGPAGPARANYVALQYLAPSLGFTVPVGACGGPTICPAGTYYVTGYTVQLYDRYRVGGILNYPSVLDVLLQHQQPSIFARMVGYSVVNTGASARATKPGPEFNGADYAVAALSGDAMINGGGAAFQTVTGPVYAYGSFGANNGPHSTGVPSQQTDYDGSPCPGPLTNQVDNGGGSNGLNYHTTDGNPLLTNPNVAPPYNYDNASPLVAPPGPRYFTAAAAQDASGNWKPGIYDGVAPSGGIISLPQSAYVSDGNSSPQFTGSVIVASMTVQGGGNGAQVFRWVCGLNAVAGQPWAGGLLR